MTKTANRIPSEKHNGRDWLENSAQANFGQYPTSAATDKSNLSTKDKGHSWPQNTPAPIASVLKPKVALVWSAQQRIPRLHNILKQPVSTAVVTTGTIGRPRHALP